MRLERDFLGEQNIPDEALYGIHAWRARENFPSTRSFPQSWYRSLGSVKQACYLCIADYRKALDKNHPGISTKLNIPGEEIIEVLEKAAAELAAGAHASHFIVPAIQGGAGTSINMNINEIIANRALQLLGDSPGNYGRIDPIEAANLYQSTNDVVPTALALAAMRELERLEVEINGSRSLLEKLEAQGRNSLRLAYTQMQEAVPATFGQLFSTYSDALSRDWWRVSKAFERIKLVNLGGGATGSAVGIPRFFLMEVVPQLKRLTGLPLTQGENLQDATSNLDKWVEVHAILKAHAVNLEKIAGDLRLLGPGAGTGEINIPARQVGSSIMPGKVNPVIVEYLVSSAHQVYANDQLITSLSAQGQLELNAYLPQIGMALLDSLDLLCGMNATLRENLLQDLEFNEGVARRRLYRSMAVCTALSPLLGYHRASELARHMHENDCDVFEANKRLGFIDEIKMNKAMEAGNLLKKGFTVNDINALE